MMLRWSLGQPEAAEAIEEAVSGAGRRLPHPRPARGPTAGTPTPFTVVGTKEMARVIGDRIAI